MRNHKEDSRRGEPFSRHAVQHIRARALARLSLSLLLGLTASAALSGCGSEAIAEPTSHYATLTKSASMPAHDMSGFNQVDGGTLPAQGSEQNQCNLEMVPYTGHLDYALFVSSLDVTHFRTQFHYVFDGTGS